MQPAQSHISRDLAAQLGHEAVEIIGRGGYEAPSGRFVSITEALRQAVAATRDFPPEVELPISITGTHDTRIEVTNETTLAAARRLLDAGLDPLILNFASATTPGGGFLSGARAQEEYLSRSSGLYACLRDQPMYEQHRRLGDPFYTDHAIYSPKVPVFRDDDGVNLLEQPWPVSMITCAAVNASHVGPERQNGILPVMYQRIRKILAVGLKQGHEGIVLGAWGCGAFGIDPAGMAEQFHRALEGPFRGARQRVIFAILDWSEEQRYIGPFRRTFGMTA